MKSQLAEAEEVASRTPDLRVWLERTAKNRPGFHLQWSWFENKPTTDLLEIANEGRNRFNSAPSYARIAEEQGGDATKEARDPGDFEDETLDYTSDTYINQLDEQLQAHARKRRVGSATPGGM